MEIIIKPVDQVSGTIAAPPSKSYSHRAIIMSSLARGKSEIFNILKANDVFASIEACKAFGAKIQEDNDRWIVEGAKLSVPKHEINCKNSGTTLRIMTSVATLVPSGMVTLTGSASLRRRPITPLLEALKQLGSECYSKNGFPPVTIRGGKLNGGIAKLPGDISSQFITGLLIACPLAKNNSTLELTTPLVSKPYVEMTLKMLNKYGINVIVDKEMHKFFIPSSQNYHPIKFNVPGDYSSAAFLFALGALAGKVEVKNLDHEDVQGDKKILEILKEMGANVRVRKDLIEIEKSDLVGIDIDCSETPDLLPICSVLGAFVKGKTHIFNAEHVRHKESDRIRSMTLELRKMGAKVYEKPDGMILEGTGKLKGAKLDSHGDHRVFMALVAAALMADKNSSIAGLETIKDSYPSFIDDLNWLGVKTEVFR